MVKEKIAFNIITITTAAALSGFPYLKYTIYTIPLLGFFIYIISGDFKLHFSRQTFPFLSLIFVSLANITDIDYNWAKQIYFIFCYTSFFLMFDFSKQKQNIELLNIVVIIIFIAKMLLSGSFTNFNLSKLSIINSKFQLERTFSFVFGLFSIYFLYEKKYLWFLLNSTLAILSFKRIVILGIFLCTLLFFIPKKIRLIFINPITLTFSILTLTIVSINISTGLYDSFILNNIGISTNQLLMGRQEIWYKILTYIKFEHSDYIFFGLGNGYTSQTLIKIFKNNVLLHNDFLLILIQYGYIFLIIFSYTLNNQKSYRQKNLAIYLTCLFATDNVLIYQHVMIIYLLLITTKSN